MLLRPVEPRQYTSLDYARLAQDSGVVLSVVMADQCFDNALAESFFAIIKEELIDTRPWPTRAGVASSQLLTDMVPHGYSTYL